MFKRKTLNGYLTIESMPTCFTYYASLAVGQKKDTVNECLDSACSLVSSHTVNPPHTHAYKKEKKRYQLTCEQKLFRTEMNLGKRPCVYLCSGSFA